MDEKWEYERSNWSKTCKDSREQYAEGQRKETGKTVTTGLITCDHGDFVTRMYSPLRLLNGECEHLVCISFQEGTSFESLCDTVNKEVEGFIDGNVIILADLPGDSPFKTATMAILQYGHTKAIINTNFPLLLGLVLSRDYAEGVGRLLSQSIDNAREALVKVSLEQ